MARLPTPGGDISNWGDILNEYLGVSHDASGAIKPAAIQSAGGATNNSVVHVTGNETIAGTKTFSSSPILPVPINGYDAATKTYVDSTTAAGSPDADATTKGIVQLAGDLAGTAASPQIANGAIVDASINAAANIAQSKIASLTNDLTARALTTDLTNHAADTTAVHGIVDTANLLLKGSLILNVKDYGAVGDGTTDDTAAINSAITAANSAGGGIVFIPTGIYGVTLTDLGARTTGVLLRSKVTLSGAGTGSVIKLLASSASTDVQATSIISNINPDTIIDTDICVRDLAIDGNAANTTGLITNGIFVGNARRVDIIGLTIKNCRGTAAGPPGETLAINLYRCVDAIVERAHVYCDAGVTASGVGFNQVTNGRVTNSDAHNLTYGVGFTFWDSSGILCVNCHSYLNGGNGFLTEYSQDVIFDNCMAGGISSDQTQTAGKTNPIATGGTQVILGNGQDTTSTPGAHSGFGIDTGTRIMIRGGVSAYTGTASYIANGVRIYGTCSEILIDCLRVYGNTYGVNFTNGDGAPAQIARARETKITQPKLIGPNKNPGGAGTDQNFFYSGGVQNYTQGQINGFLEPAIAASTTAVQNPFPFDVWVRVIAGTVTVINITPGGQSPSAAFTTGATSGMVFVPHNGSIAITYSSAPTWDWIIA